jgi:hypothetical protein
MIKTTTLEIAPLNDDDQNMRIEFERMKDRMQLMKDLFKTYYIDDKIFQKLNEARKDNASNDSVKNKNVKGEPSFTSVNQEDEEMPINRTDQIRDSRLSQ